MDNGHDTYDRSCHDNGHDTYGSSCVQASDWLIRYHLRQWLYRNAMQSLKANLPYAMGRGMYQNDSEVKILKSKTIFSTLHAPRHSSSCDL